MCFSLYFFGWPAGIVEIASHFRFDNLVHMLIKLLACSLSSMYDTRWVARERERETCVYLCVCVRERYRNRECGKRQGYEKRHILKMTFNKYLWNDCVARIIKPILVAMRWQSCRVYTIFFFNKGVSPSNYHFN